MKKKINIVIMGVLLFPICVWAQTRFQYSPANPHPGDTVRFSYTPPAGWSNEIPHCVIRNVGFFDDHYCRMEFNAVTGKIKEIDWKKVGKEYKGEIITSPETALLTFSFNYGNIKLEQVADKAFFKEGKTDWNDNTGFVILMKNKENQPVPRANLYAALYLGLDDGVFYRNNGLGMTNTKLALEYLDQELALYPPSRSVLVALMFIMDNDKNAYNAKAKDLLEQQFKKGLESEDDFTVASSLANGSDMENLSTYLQNLRDEKFKNIPSRTSLFKLFISMNGKTPAGQDSLVQAMAALCKKIPEGRINSIDSRWALVEKAQYRLLTDLAQKGDTTLFTQYAKKYQFTIAHINDPFINQIAEAWLQSGSIGALHFLKKGYDYFRKGETVGNKSGNWSSGDPNEAYFTRSEIKDHVLMGVCTFSDYLNQYYAAKNDFSAALPFAKTAIDYLAKINDLRFRVHQSTSIRVNCIKTMEKVLPELELKKLAEQAIDNPDWDPYVKEILKKIYINENKTDRGFDSYFRGLRNKQIQNFTRHLKTKQINESAPLFTLSNLKGEQVSLENLRGKVVVMDFWATWCGICITEFPAMQEMINSYQDDPNVVFLFVDGWEKSHTQNEESILKKIHHVLDSKKLSFNVLLDKDNKVVTDYNVPGMPFKVIMDKSGNIRYKIHGGNRNNRQFADELSAMIESLK